MNITKTMVDEALDFYGISDNEYKEKCYNCIYELEKNKKYQEKVNEVYNYLFIDKNDKIRYLWQFKNLSDLFGNIKNPFITNILLLSGYEFHKSNIEKYSFDDEQIAIHKKRVKECLLNDIKIRKYNGIRISQMLWGAYFINIRIIEVGRLQYEFVKINPLNEKEHKECIKIHIPSGEKLDLYKVKESLNKSKQKIKEYFKIENAEYFCDSWLLSKQIRECVDEKSNIAQFYNLFNVVEKDDALSDVLNYIFNLKECDNFNALPQNTSLQRKVKEILINGGIIKSGLGILKSLNV